MVHRIQAVLLLMVLLLTAGLLYKSGGTAGAHTPHAGLDFSFGVDTDGDSALDCGTDVGQVAKCTAPLGSIMQVRVYRNSLGSLNMRAFQIFLEHSGVTPKNNPSSEYWHPNCQNPLYNLGPGHVVWGCAEFAPPAPDPLYLGLIGTIGYTCTDSGALTLLHAPRDGTSLLDPDLLYHAEGNNVGETLTINCAEVPPVGGISADVSGRGDNGFPLRNAAIAGALVLAITVLGITLRRQQV